MFTGCGQVNKGEMITVCELCDLGSPEIPAAMEAARGRVAAGAAYFDEIVPGWRDRVNVAILDINSPRYCVAGQIYGDYPGAYGYGYDYWADEIRAAIGDETTYGLNAGRDDDGVFVGTATLTDAWKELLSA